MATVAEIEQQIAALRAQLGSLEAAKNAVLQEINTLTAEMNDLRAAARRQAVGGDMAGADALRAQAAQIEARIGQLYQSPAFTNLTNATQTIFKHLRGAGLGATITPNC